MIGKGAFVEKICEAITERERAGSVQPMSAQDARKIARSGEEDFDPMTLTEAVEHVLLLVRLRSGRR